MYVRCPIDELDNPRSFITGQISKIDEFADTVLVHFRDPYGFREYYEKIPQEATVETKYIKRCAIYADVAVNYRGKQYVVVAKEKVEDWYYYALQDRFGSNFVRVKESEIEAPFLYGRISPADQLLNYEFQNPAWYFGRSVVSKTIKILENSVFGFKELAGCKIYLMPHQLKTIMRCLQDKNCRYMLADEVGMGKTIEASSVLKVFLRHNTNKRVLIAVPAPLVAQWKNELFIKFEINLGRDTNDNYVELIPSDQVETVLNNRWDFVIADEAHKLLNNKRLYEYFHQLSQKTDNILLLSATPIQQRQEAYLALLRLILPDKYDHVSIERFMELVEKQKSITKSTYLVLQNYDDYIDNIDDLLVDDEDPSEDEDCEDLFDDIVSGLKRVNKIINDDSLKTIISGIDFDSQDYGRSSIQEAILYICENYQLEKNIIRNRRRYMSDLAKRSLEEIPYELDPERNNSEYATYDAMVDWIVNQNLTPEQFKAIYIPLLEALFSSSWAFMDALLEVEKKGVAISEEVEIQLKGWIEYEQQIIDNLDDVLAEPYNYSSRMLGVIDFLDQQIVDEKVVLFTNFSSTFDHYQNLLNHYFGEECVSIFRKGMSPDDLEFNIYKFQNDAECKFLLCDETGGEGRNLQGADYVVHIDLPWDANAIEQRIGRLDRLGRNPEKDVCSVVIYSTRTLEEELFKFWNNGLNIFEQSLSGLEIIMNDINNSIIKAVTSDFRYGISNAIEETITSSQAMEKDVREEQHFDTAAFIYASLNQELTRLLRYYTENENKLFADTMMGWSNLAGLRGNISKSGVVRFNASSFSIKSAENSMLVPPNWMAYISKASNAFNARIRELYQERIGQKQQGNVREITGTFERTKAIENDYLHFFAPGDEIFDCIVDNAMHSYKGQCTAIAIESDFDWMGMVFTWSLSPNEALLLDKGIPLVALRQYKNYICTDQISTAVAFQRYEDVDSGKVLKLLERTASCSISRIKDEVVHLGRRSKKNDFLNIKNRYGCSNVDWFKEQFPKEHWENLVSQAMLAGKSEARTKFTKGSNIKQAETEINRTISAEIAQAKYYGLKAEEIAKKREQYDIVIQALKKSKFEIESAAFVWVVNRNGH